MVNQIPAPLTWWIESSGSAFPNPFHPVAHLHGLPHGILAERGAKGAKHCGAGGRKEGRRGIGWWVALYHWLEPWPTSVWLSQQQQAEGVVPARWGAWLQPKMPRHTDWETLLWVMLISPKGAAATELWDKREYLRGEIVLWWQLTDLEGTEKDSAQCLGLKPWGAYGLSPFPLNSEETVILVTHRPLQQNTMEDEWRISRTPSLRGEKHGRHLKVLTRRTLHAHMRLSPLHHWKQKQNKKKLGH